MLRLAQEQYGPLFCRDLGSKSQIWGPNLKASRPKKIENFPENRLVKEKFMTPPWWDRRDRTLYKTRVTTPRPRFSH